MTDGTDSRQIPPREPAELSPAGAAKALSFADKITAGKYLEEADEILRQLEGLRQHLHNVTDAVSRHRDRLAKERGAR